MSGLTLYHSPYSPFSRSVLLLCRYLKLDVHVKVLNLLNDEQMSAEFVKINPQHCVPTIDDEGFYLWESRAILTYLIESRAPHLMPTSPKEKAVMNQRLQFEQGKLATKYAELFRPLFEGGTEIKQQTVSELHEILNFIDEYYFPNDNEWIAGENITAADFAYASTIEGLVAAGASLDKYPRLGSWHIRCKSTFPDYTEANESGAKLFGDWITEHATKGF